MSSVKTKLDEMAYARDAFKCTECGRTHGIEAHHIIPGIEKLENLVTLCHRCHKKRHNMSGCFKKGYDARRNTKSNAKLKSGEVWLIKRLLKNTHRKQSVICKMFMVDNSTISDIKTGRTWV